MKRVSLAVSFAFGCALYAGFGTGCGSSSRSDFADPDAEADGGPGGHLGDTDAAAAAPPDCSPTSTNLSGCPCSQRGQTQACYSGPAGTRAIGACRDGSQTCAGSTEFNSWGPCSGDVTPGAEVCAGKVDANCNGRLGCDDPSCAKDPLCDTACTDGQTRACYSGPAGTDNRGTCKDGVQKCVGSKWASGCTGEVLPAAENCCDALDHNCNGLAGCSDLFLCITASCCQNACTPANVDPGCVCPTGAGDSALCPGGTHGVTKGIGFPPLTECCPCTASTCNDPGCCAESVCVGKPACAGVTCAPLAPSCNGKVNADCDDFPEDCDEPCCKCKKCP